MPFYGHHKHIIHKRKQMILCNPHNSLIFNRSFKNSVKAYWPSISSHIHTKYRLQQQQKILHNHIILIKILYINNIYKLYIFIYYKLFIYYIV